MAKIGIIISSLYACGGEERVVSLMANEWVRYHEVTIFTFESREAEGGSRNDYFLSDRIKVVRVSNTGSNKMRTLVKLLYFYTGMTGGPIFGKLLKDAFYPNALLTEWINRINEGGFDLMIAVSGVYTMLLGYIREQIHAKTICWEHSSYEGYFDPQKGYYRNRIVSYRECASKMDACVVLNKDTRRKYKENLDLDAVVISNPKSFSSEEKADVRQKCFVTCGRVEAEKGYDDLIEAFAAFCRDRQDWKLLIIGGGSLQKKCEDLAMQRGIGDRVTITGYTNEVKSYLLQGSVFVMTSRWEGFGMVVVEAFELGIPVITYGIPAMRLLVSDGADGRVVPAFEREKLVEAMKELAGDVGLRERMGLKATEKAALMKPEVIAEKWLTLFEEVLEK